MGKVINEFHVNRLCNLLKDHQGEVVIGNKDAHEDKLLTPTVVLNPSAESPLMKEEIFGPILPVIPYKTIEEAIKFINSKDKPLTLYYMGTANSANQLKIQAETSSGSFVTNETLFQNANPDLPFGGVGASGYGKYHGFEGFRVFSNQKSIFIKKQTKMEPDVYPPFTPEKQKFIRFLFRILNTTQAGMVKRFVYTIVALFILWGLATGRIKRAYLKGKKLASILKMVAFGG